MIIFTSICANYAHKARILAESVKKNIPDAQFFVCLTERQIPDQIQYECFDKIILSKDMWPGNFDQFIFKHSIVEASTAVKAHFFQYLMKTYAEENLFVYLDPDCCVYADFGELREKLMTKPAVLCPHLLQPGNIDMELSSTAHGVYNLGFLAVRNCPEGRQIIDWWAERLYLFCYDDIQNGIFTDQKWMDLLPCFFDVEIFKHRGYDFAPWSLLDCGMTKEEDGYYIKGDPLRFIHFSGYGKTAQMCMSKWLPEGPHPFKELYEQYAKIHEEYNRNGISKLPWSYSRYESGEVIDDRLRKKYRSNYEVMFSTENPFALSNAYFEKKLADSSFLRRFFLNFRLVICSIQEDGWKETAIKVKNVLKSIS